MIADLRKAVPHILIALILSIFIIAPMFARAQDSGPIVLPPIEVTPDDEEPTEGGGPAAPPDDDEPNEGGGPAETPDQGSVSLINPLKFGSIEEFLFAIIDIILVFAVPLIVLFIMYAGFKFVTAQGNATAVTDARKQLQWAVIGGLIVLGARIIYELIENTVATFGT